MAATMFESRPIPGPQLRRVGGYRGYLRAFEREPLAYVKETFQAYGAVSGLVAGDTRLIFALGSAGNERLRADPRLFGPPAPETRSAGLTSTTIARLAAWSRTREHDQELARAWRAELANPAASPAYQHLVVETAERVAERWGLGQQLDLLYVSRRLHLRILFKALLGIDPTNEPGATLLDQWTNVLACRQPGWLARLTELAQRRTDRLFEQVVLARMGQAPQSDSAFPGDFLSRLEGENDAERHASDREARIKQVAGLVHQAETILTSALVWTIVLLAQHQRVLSDVRAELDAVEADHQVSTGHSFVAAERLPLLERVIKESLRLLPPLSLGLRQMAAPADILDYALPPQAAVLYSPYLTHQLSGLFVAPRRFRPERWLYIEPTADEYLPLGLADDSVLDLPFVMLHTKLVLALWLQHARLVLAPSTRIDYRLQPLLLPQNAVPMIVAPRDRPQRLRPVRGSITTLVDFEG
ncbi:MAG: hypothetical protein CYG59_19560 [Chloroflexi bacterium]|nr:MAG: hypothetical protein CYG59_19560 [Chloroflexota bacterium]